MAGCRGMWQVVVVCGRVRAHMAGDGGMSQGLGAYSSGICQMSKKSKMFTMNEVHKKFNLTQ